MNSISFKQLFSLFLVLGIFFSSQSTFAQQKPASKLLLRKEGNPIQNQYIVVVEDNFLSPYLRTEGFKSLKSREAKAKGLAAHEAAADKKIRAELRKLDISNDAILKTFSGSFSGFVIRLNRNQIQLLLKLKWVKWIEQDGRLKIVDIIRPKKPVNTQRVDWGVEAVGSKSGVGKYAFVVDTGVDLDHPDLNVNRGLSRSFIALEPGKDDRHGHGTHVSGIIGAKNNLIGTKGVAAGATIVGLKVLNQNGNGTWSDIVAATSYAGVVANPRDVVNYSLGGSGYVFTLDWAIRLLLGARGIYVTIAAGNNNSHAGGYMPARVNGSKIFTISNMDSNRRITTTSSNFGNGPIDYAAPGQFIYSTFKNGGYTTMSGTSMAAPHVAGIILVNNGTINTDGLVATDKDANRDRVASVN